MKKRILSILLVVAMMVSTFSILSIPTHATTFSWDSMFEELDGRNIGQYKLNVGSVESTGVKVDGKIDANDNYTMTQVFNYGELNSGTVKAATADFPDITVKMARKGDKLYIAFVAAESFANSKIRKIQLGLGTSRGYTLGHTIDRVITTLNANDTISGVSRTFSGYTAYNDSKEVPNRLSSYVTAYVKDWSANDSTATIVDATEGVSVYEVEADITALAVSLTPSGKTPSPSVSMMQFMFYYYSGTDAKTAQCYYFEGDKDAVWKRDVNPYYAATTDANNNKFKTYAEFKAALNAKYSKEIGATYTYAPGTMGYPVAFGGVSVPLSTTQDALGLVGKDVRVLEADQLIDIETEAIADPILDGKIGDGEYTIINKTLLHAKKQSPKYNASGAIKDGNTTPKYDNGESAVSANFAYKDGYLYIAVTTEDTSIRSTQLDMNVMPYSYYADTTINRLSNTVSDTGVVTPKDYPSFENGANGWFTNDLLKDVFFDFKGFSYIVDTAASLNNDGHAVYEYKVSLATLSEYWSKAYVADDGFTYFGFQFWSAGNDGYFGGDNDQYGFRHVQTGEDTTTTHTYRSAIDPSAWNLEWALYTISIPEEVDSFKAEHKVKHFYNGVDFSTQDSASVRISSAAAGTGLRFKTTFDAQYLADLKAVAGSNEITYGTLIAPADYITATGEFTKEALDAKYGVGKGYIDVVANIENPYEKDSSGNVTIAGSITNIKTGNLGRDFTAIAYVQYGDTIIYSPVTATRNVSKIATDALGDTNAEETDVYKYKVSEGVWSPYSDSQRTVLNGLKAK